MWRRVIKTAFTNSAIRKRILVVLTIIVIYRILANIPVPIGDTATLTDFLRNLFASNRLFAFVDLFSGGALSNFSIVLMGLGPYINASIIMQLLTQVVPSLSKLQKESEHGRRQINQYTRLLTLPLAIAQSIGTVFFIKRLAIQGAQTDIIGNPSISQWVIMIAAITGGSLLLMWLGELISEKGIGNGISLLIFASVVSQFPTQLGQLVSLVQSGSTQFTTLLVFLLAAILVIYSIVKLNEGQRNIPISYAKRIQGARVYGGVESTIPVKILTGGVVPIIFAIAFLSVPPFVGQLFSNARSEWLADLARNLTTWFSPTSTVYAVTYFLLVVVFTFFYVGVVFNTRELAEKLQKEGGFIPGVRPGAQTADYLTKVVRRITFFGALSLGVIALLPFIGERITGTTALTFGGTSLLIMVSVAIETLNQLNSQAVTASY